MVTIGNVCAPRDNRRIFFCAWRAITNMTRSCQFETEWWVTSHHSLWIWFPNELILMGTIGVSRNSLFAAHENGEENAMIRMYSMPRQRCILKWLWLPFDYVSLAMFGTDFLAPAFSGCISLLSMFSSIHASCHRCNAVRWKNHRHNQYHEQMTLFAISIMCLLSFIDERNRTRNLKTQTRTLTMRHCHSYALTWKLLPTTLDF